MRNVLVISHNAFSSTQNNGKTLESFFKNWEKEHIAQLFFQTDVPDFDFCENYFNLNDFDMLNRLIKKKAPGKKLEKLRDMKNGYAPSVEKLYRDGSDKTKRKGINRLIHKLQMKGSSLVGVMRAFIWSGEKWKSEQLLKWIEDFAPDVVFFQGSSNYYIYDIVLWICEKYNLPLVLELTDDYTTIRRPLSIVSRILNRKYLKSFQKAITKASKVITICDYMAKEYKERFGGKYISLLNSVDEVEKTEENKENINFIFAGNVGLKRHEVLTNIGKALQEINEEENKNIKLNIFAPTGILQKRIDQFNSIKAINFGGSLNTEQLKEQVKQSNFLVHVESFDKKMMKVTRLSISTKIPEYLASHRCIFAVGPECVSSMKYLIENDAGFTCTKNSIREIKKSILNMISNESEKQRKIENQLALYRKNHKSVNTQKIIEEVIDKAL